mgnify:CR=1 FL=1|tara:strand:- start:11 stop:394 length:384 start_codon:yes stop_codon:yes gene_type:complete
MSEEHLRQRLREAVTQYLEIDTQIDTLQKALRERKKKKEELSKIILGTMKDNDIDQMNLKGNKFIYQVSEYKTPINKNYLNSIFNKYFNNNEEKTNELIEHIFNNRQKIEKIRLKRVTDKTRELKLQ